MAGTGQAQTNPVHEADVAKALVDGLEGREQEVDVGGPEILTWDEIADMAAAAAGDAPVRFSFVWAGAATGGDAAGSRDGRGTTWRSTASRSRWWTWSRLPWGERRLEDYFAPLAG